MGLLTAGFYEYPERWNRDIKVLPHDRLLAATLLRLLPDSVKPNHLTLVRLVLIVPVLVLVGLDQFAVGTFVFLVAALTDALDGSLARTRRQISQWGIIWDPIADKILVGSLVALVVIDLINPYLGLALIFVEFLMLAGGWRRLRRNQVQPANFWGKAKMVFEVSGLTLLLIAAWLKIDLLVGLSADTLVLALIFALVSVMTRIM